MMSYIANLLSDVKKEHLDNLAKKYPLLENQSLRWIHNELMIQCIDHYRSKLHRNNIKMLDLGCGYNYMITNSGLEGDERVGVDIIDYSESDKILLENKNNKFHSQYIMSDIESFESVNKFDIIVVSEVSEHVLSPTKLFNKISTLLSDDGYGIISFPNILFWKERLNFLLHGKFKNYKKLNYRYGHTNIYTKETFNTLIELEGLKSVGRWPSFSYPIPKLEVIKKNNKFSDLLDYGVIWITKKV